jgi:outer membrane protein OmpA-like peptidoglycan-associated protein
MSLVSLVLLASLAKAQDVGGFDAHGFHLAAHDGDLRDPLAVQRPAPFSQGDWFVADLGEYASSPLVLTENVDDSPDTEGVLTNVVAMNLSAGVALHDRIQVDLNAPVFLFTTGSDEAAGGPALGDLRATAMLVAVRPRPVVTGGGFGLGLVAHLDLPTGPEERYLGERTVAGGLRMAATHELRDVTFSGEVGWQFAPSIELTPEYAAAFPEDDGNNAMDAVLLGLGVGVATSDSVGLTLEAVAEPRPFPLEGPPATTTVPAEAMLSLRALTERGAFWTFGVAGGLTGAPGVAAARVFVGGGFARREPLAPADSDIVGALQTTDGCPLEAESVNGYKDEDGCPDQLGTLVVDTRFRGEPLSIDAEVFGPDGRQAVRIGPRGLSFDAVPGTQWTVKAMEGCLFGEATALATEGGTRLVVDLAPVHDARLVVEVFNPSGDPLTTATVQWFSTQPECVPAGTFAADALGHVVQELSAGTHRIAVTAPSYTVHEEELTLLAGDDRRLQVRLDAAKLVIEKRRIRILEKVQFEFGKAVLRSASHDLLDQVAAVIITHPDLGRVEVAGHTDSKGSDSYNLELSARRAEAVRDYLVKAGVGENRLLAAGYGELRPIDTNRTEEGRELNRRVEFNLVDAPADAQGEGAP